MRRCLQDFRILEEFGSLWHLFPHRINDFERLDPPEILCVMRGKRQSVIQGSCRN